MVYVLANYGEKHLGFLLTSLYSIKKNAPDAEIFVFWQDIESEIFSCSQQVYSDVKFVKTNFDIQGNQLFRTSSKTFLWHYAAQFLCDLGYTDACFLDCDTLLIKDVKYLFSQEFDIGFSVKKDVWPLNTGVLLVKLSEKTTDFFLRWQILTLDILNDPISFQQANVKDFPYGGADQMSFYKLINYIDGQVIFKSNSLTFKAFDSKVINQTESVELQECNHIIHYKGGWQSVLLEGDTFKYRSLADSLPQYRLFASNYIETKGMFVNFYPELERHSLGIKLPSWYSTKRNKVIRVLYVKKQFTSYCSNYIKVISKIFFTKSKGLIVR